MQAIVYLFLVYQQFSQPEVVSDVLQTIPAQSTFKTVKKFWKLEDYQCNAEACFFEYRITTESTTCLDPS